MKTVITLVLFFMATTCFGQAKKIDFLHTALKQAFEVLRKENIDTIFTYYSYCTGCNDLSENQDCQGFIAAKIVWIKDGKIFNKKVTCDEKDNETRLESSDALQYFIKNRQELTTRKLLPNQKFFPPLSVHYDVEDFFLFLNGEVYETQLLKEQKEKKVWRKYSWVKPTIILAELNKKEKQLPTTPLR